MVRKRVGCLHAHYSNIGYIEQALSGDEVECIHFVDPGLVGRVSTDVNFSLSDAERRVREQIEWIAQCRVDAVLITCTNYIALLQEEQLSISVPIIKMDEPFFNYLCNESRPQILLFTNPATVEGTMRRLDEYTLAIGKKLQVENRIIGDAFELIMQGKKEQYMIVLSKYIRDLMEAEKDKLISVAQLSMVKAAGLVSKETGIPIGNPLEPLKSHMRSLIL